MALFSLAFTALSEMPRACAISFNRIPRDSRRSASVCARVSALFLGFVEMNGAQRRLKLADLARCQFAVRRGRNSRRSGAAASSSAVTQTTAPKGIPKRA